MKDKNKMNKQEEKQTRKRWMLFGVFIAELFWGFVFLTFSFIDLSWKVVFLSWVLLLGATIHFVYVFSKEKKHETK